MTHANNINNNTLFPPEILHQIYKSLDLKQRICQIPTVCSEWNKACQSQQFPIEIDLSIHLSMFERYFFQNSVRTSQIQLNNSLNTISAFPNTSIKNNTIKEKETIYGKCKSELKYQPFIFKKVRNGNDVDIKIINNTSFQIKEMFQEKLKKNWNILSHGKDIPNRNLIPILNNIQFYVESPALWFDPMKYEYFIPVLHDIFYNISPYAPVRIDVGLISLPVLYQIPINIKHLTLCLLMRDYGEAMKYICNKFTQLESLDLTVKSNHVFTPELNEIINVNHSSTTTSSISNSNSDIVLDKEFIDNFKNNDVLEYNMTYISSNMDNIMINPEYFRDLVKLKNLQKFSIHNPVRQISNVKLMYNILSSAKSLKELSFSPRLLLTRVDDRHLISMIHSLVKLYHLDFENAYLELWKLIKTCDNITELSLNYTHSYLSSLVRDALSQNIPNRSNTHTNNDDNNNNNNNENNENNHNDNVSDNNNNTSTSIALVASTQNHESNRFNELFHTRLNRNNIIRHHHQNNRTNNVQNHQINKITDDYFEKSIQGIASCFPNLEKLQISWQATHFSSVHDYTISSQKLINNLVYLKNKTKLKSITMLYKDAKLASKLEKALGKDVEIKIYQ